MPNEETLLDEDIDTQVDEEVEDTKEEDLTDSENDEDEFEYDEDGNIIIPDVVSDEEEADETDEEETDEEETGEEEESDDTETKGEEDKTTEEDTSEEPEPTKSELDAELEKQKAEVIALKAQVKETLSKLGVENDDIMDGLVSLAAEADGITTKEYLQKKEAAEREARARALLQSQEFEKIATADIAELHATYPETQKYKHVRDLPPDIKAKFGRFRDAGLSAKEAYAAANPDGIRNTVATAVKKQSLHDSKSHLRTTVPKGSKDHSIVMPKEELARWRDLFPHMSSKEIVSLYKKTAK